MQLEQSSDALRQLGERLFAVVEKLTGARPQLLPDGSWYRAEARGRAFVYLRLIGEEARRFSPNSVHLATRWDERLHAEGVTKGNNWYGRVSADLTARAGNPEEVARAERFLHQTFALYGGEGAAPDSIM